MIKTSVLDGVEVVLCDERVPVIVQSPRGLIFAKGLCIGILIDDGPAVCPLVEEGWSDPWLQNKPTAKVYSVYFLTVVVEAYISCFRFTKIISRVQAIVVRMGIKLLTTKDLH